MRAECLRRSTLDTYQAIKYSEFSKNLAVHPKEGTFKGVENFGLLTAALKGCRIH
jgi:hypothetical protein